MNRFFNFLKQRTCFHEFYLKDLKITGILPPKEPSKSCLDFPSLKEAHRVWGKYWDEYWHGDWATKRVAWSCHKCKREFFGHCGLDISPHHGSIVPEPKAL